MKHNYRAIAENQRELSRPVQGICNWLDRVEKSKIAKYSWLTFIVGTLFLFSYGMAKAQNGTAGLTLTTGTATIGQGQHIELSIHLDTAVAAYYFESELNFDSGRLAFVNVKPGAVLQDTNGIAVGNLLSAGTAGVSASRVSGEGTGPGNLLRARFEVKADADTGQTALSIANPVLKDSAGTIISTSLPSSIQIRIKPKITVGGLTKGAYTIHEAQSVQLEGFTFAHEVTNTTTPSDSLRVWFGMSMSNADPTTWTEQQWSRADELSTDADGNSHFGATFGPALSVGNWYYAARFQLNNNTFRYGGFAADTGSFWQADSAPAGILTVEERPPYQHVLALWDFDDQNVDVDQSLTANRQSRIHFTGSQLEGYDIRGNGYTMATDSWHMEQGADSLKYIKIGMSTTDFQDIRVSSSFRGTSSSARDFQLQMSLDDSLWADVPGGSIVVTEQWGDGSLVELTLPAEANNRSNLYLRWQRIGDTRVDGTQDVSSQGKVRMDDIKITGTAISPTSPTVWPGDADNNGVVDIADVLPLGTWWKMQGPDRIIRDISWAGMEAIGWFPFEATFADTDGSGGVDHSDLEAIGMNFGDTWQQVQHQNNDSTYLARLTIPKLRQGQTRSFTITTPEPTALSGLSLTLDWATQPSEKFVLKPVFEESDWMYQWKQNNNLLHYVRQSGDEWSGAWVHRGWTEPKQTRRLMKFKIRSKEDWEQQITLGVVKAKRAYPDRSATTIDNLDMELGTVVDITEQEDSKSPLPSTTHLLPNHPNPFNPATSLRYELANSGRISFHIYSLLGKKVATLVENEYQRAGSYSYKWNAKGLSSGIYLYVLKTDQKEFTGKMLLMK